MPKYRIVIELETEQAHEPRFLEAALLMALGPKGIFPVGGTMRVSALDPIGHSPIVDGPTGTIGPMTTTEPIKPIDFVLDYRNREEP